jgi:hypothetical protein
MSLISKSGPRAETVAGESFAAIRTPGLVAVKNLEKFGERLRLRSGMQ